MRNLVLVALLMVLTYAPQSQACSEHGTSGIAEENSMHIVLMTRMRTKQLMKLPSTVFLIVSKLFTLQTSPLAVSS